MTRIFRVLASALACVWLLGVYSAAVSGDVPPVVEAPAGFDNLTNGFVDQDEFNAVLETFQEPAGVRGQVIQVPVLEAAAGVTRVARFGWKNQHASLVSFSSDAYLNEMGITNRFNLVENTSMGTYVATFPYDLVPDDQPCA